MFCSMPGLPVHHQLPEFTQTHVHWVSDAIQPSHPLSSPSPPASKSFPTSESFPMSQLFTWGGQSIGVSASTSVLPMNTQDWSPLGWTGWISLQSKGLSKEPSSIPQFKSIIFSALSFLHSPTLTSIHDHWKQFMANRWGKNGNGNRLYFLGLQNHCRWWLQPWNEKMFAPWRKSYDKPRQHIKKQRHHFADEGLYSQSYCFSEVMYGCESWTIKKAEHQRIDVF